MTSRFTGLTWTMLHPRARGFRQRSFPLLSALMVGLALLLGCQAIEEAPAPSQTPAEEVFDSPPPAAPIEEETLSPPPAPVTPPSAVAPAPSTAEPSVTPPVPGSVTSTPSSSTVPSTGPDEDETVPHRHRLPLSSPGAAPPGSAPPQAAPSQ